VELVNPDVKKSDSEKENTEITNFFKRVAMFSFLQSGLNKSFVSFSEVIPQHLYTGLMEEAVKKYGDVMNGEILNDFIKLFDAANPEFGGPSPSRFAKQSYRFKNFLSDKPLSTLISTHTVKTEEGKKVEQQLKEQVQPGPVKPSTPVVSGNLKEAHDRFLADWLKDNPRFFYDAPADLKGFAYEDWYTENVESGKVNPIRITMENVDEARRRDKEQGDIIFDNHDLIASLWKPGEWTEANGQDFNGFERLLKDINAGKMDDEELAWAKALLTKYGVAQSSGASPNTSQLILGFDNGSCA
jgi:hypothetical protein